MSKQNSERITGLLEEEPISFYSSAAIAFGVNEAIVLQQISFYMNVNKKKHSQRHFIKGRWWVFNTYKQWCDEHFPWLSERGLQGVILGLEKEGVLLSMQGVENSRDRRKWYSVDRLKVAEFVQSATQKRAMHDAKSAPSHDAKSVSWMTKKVGDEIPESTSETSTERKEKEELHISAVADAIYVPSNSDDWDVAQDASDSAMFSVEGQKQNSAQAEKVKTSKGKAKDVTTPIPLPPSPAPASIAQPPALATSDKDIVKTAKGKKTPRFTQEETREMVKALGEALEIPPVGKDFGLYASIAGDLVADCTIPVEEFAAHVKFCKDDASGLYEVTVTTLTAKGRPSRYVAQRGKKAEAARQQKELEERHYARHPELRPRDPSEPIEYATHEDIQALLSAALRPSIRQEHVS